jgi:hypothetical protein
MQATDAPVQVTVRPPREPEHIRPLMQDWRDGLSAFPQAYNDYHYALAEARVSEFLEMGLCVGKPETVNDGWGDGFRPMQIQAVTPSGRRLTLKWNDSNRDFMVASERSGGHSMLFPKDLL